jgi:GTP diphosphokinase / guanosine-3',5'-bis(diphosphate) 3'-diphosphatase
MKTLLLKAIHLASEKHDGQLDLSGQPYILHPLTVMLKMHTEEERVCAILHDVIEDCDISIDELQKELGLTSGMCQVINLLTKIKDSDYEEYISKIKSNSTARKIKIADLEHNMDIKRIIGRSDMTEKDKTRMAKYYKAWSYLTGE